MLLVVLLLLSLLEPFQPPHRNALPGIVYRGPPPSFVISFSACSSPSLSTLQRLLDVPHFLPHLHAPLLATLALVARQRLLHGSTIAWIGSKLRCHVGIFVCFSDT
jgi:hypothetical protein